MLECAESWPSPSHLPGYSLLITLCRQNLQQHYYPLFTRSLEVDHKDKNAHDNCLKPGRRRQLRTQQLQWGGGPVTITDMYMTAS